MNQALPVEAETAALLGFAEETVRIVQAVKHAVERGNARRSCREDNHLQRGRDRLARRVERQAEVGAKVVRPGDQAGSRVAISPAASTPAAVSIIARTGFATASATPCTR